MTQETDRSTIVQRILSRQCVRCGTDLLSDNSCELCSRIMLTSAVDSLQETLNGKISQVKDLLTANSDKLDEISVLVEQIKRLNHRTNKP